MKNYEIRVFSGNNSYDYVVISAQNTREAAEKSGFSDCKVSVIGTNEDGAVYKLNEKGRVVYEYTPQI